MTDYTAKKLPAREPVMLTGTSSPRNLTAPAASEWPTNDMDASLHEGANAHANGSQDAQEDELDNEPEEARLSDKMRTIIKGSSIIPPVIYAPTSRALPQSDAERWRVGMPVPEPKFGTLFFQPLRQFINASMLKMHVSRVVPTVLRLKSSIIVWTSLDCAEIMNHASATMHTTMHQALGHTSPRSPLTFRSLSLEEVQEYSVGCSFESVRERNFRRQVLFCLDDGLQELSTLTEPHSSEDLLLQTVGMCMRVKRWRGFGQRYAKCLILRHDYLSQGDVAANMDKWLHHGSSDI